MIYFLLFNQNKVMNKVKDQIIKRGSKLAILGKTFRSSQSYDGNKKISKDDFIFTFKELSIDLDEGEFDVSNNLIFNLYSKSNFLNLLPTNKNFTNFLKNKIV